LIKKDLTPTTKRLFTWVDVDNYFAALAASQDWPDWLLEVDAYWPGVELTINEGVEESEVWEWLASALGLLTVDRVTESIILDSAGGGRPFPVSLRRASEQVGLDRVPRWTERRIVSQLAHALPRPKRPTFAVDVQICAFHSFKGGVGRTLHCVALARQLARSPAAGKRKVLLVDADMVAPGITWMVGDRIERIDFAFEDFVALLHGSVAGDISEPLTLAEGFLANQEIDGVVVLPARRSSEVIGPPRIEPADLPSPRRSRYFLTESLAELAAKIGADVALIDLRAGASELSAPVLLDPRVLRLFVTTADDQSVRGTVNILRHIGRQAPSQEPTDPRCAMLVTQFDERRHDGIVFDVVAELIEEMAGTDRPKNSAGGNRVDPVADRVENRPLFSPFDQRLLALPGDWDDVCLVIDDCDLGGRMKVLADWLRLPPSAVDTARSEDRFDVVAARGRLHDEAARSLADARTAPDLDVFLPTKAVTRLLWAHRTEAPIVCLVGAPGAGKTFTYLRMCASRTWADFAGVARAASGGDRWLDAPLVPVVAPSRLGAHAENLIADAVKSARGLGGSTPTPASNLRERIAFLIEESLQKSRDENSWCRVWLTCMAWSVGVTATIDEVELKLAEFARDHRAIFVIDGLEDLFQHVAEREQEQRAVRALLINCAAWLRKLRGNPLGLVVFARHDLVFHSSAAGDALRFVELKRNRVEALRFTASICDRAGALALREPEIASAGQDVLSRFLVQLWGYRFDSGNLRRVRSEDWFVAAL
jgi:cellulose biosynthesis protein BcsQ